MWYATDNVTVNNRGNNIGCLSWNRRADHVSSLSYRDVKSVYTTWYATDNVTVNNRGNNIGCLSWSHQADHVSSLSYRDVKSEICCDTQWCSLCGL